ncbi:MAG: DoxX family protein [Candidatus Kapaibacterium sp.]
MRNFLNNPWLSLLARLIAGGMFILTGWVKIADPHGFADEIANYGILSGPLLNLSAIILPWLELIVGIFFIAGLRIRANTLIIGGLLVVFIAAVASAWARGLNIDCGCYSDIATQKVGIEKLLENTGLLLLTIYVYLNSDRRFTVDRFLRKKA